jgi:hypothetical protein
MKSYPLFHSQDVSSSRLCELWMSFLAFWAPPPVVRKPLSSPIQKRKAIRAQCVEEILNIINLVN